MIFDLDFKFGRLKYVLWSQWTFKHPIKEFWRQLKTVPMWDRNSTRRSVIEEYRKSGVFSDEEIRSMEDELK